MYSNQQAYYDAIIESSRQGQSGPFIDFMLEEILKTLMSKQGDKLPPLSDGETTKAIEGTWCHLAPGKSQDRAMDN